MTDDLTPTDTIEADEALDNLFEEPETPDILDADPDEGQSGEESDAGQSRGEDGRFESTESEDADDGQGDEPPEAPPEGSAESDEETAPVPVVEENNAVEFVYKADGAEHVIPGSLYDPDKGLFIPPDQVAAAQHLFSSGKAMDGSFKRRLQESNQREVRSNTRAEAAEKALQETIGYFDRMIESDTIAEFLSDQQQNWDVLKERAKLAEAEYLRNAAETELEGYRNEQQAAQIEPLVINQLQETVGQYGDALGLSQSQRDAVVSQLRSDRYRPMLYRPVNDTEAIANNMKVGDMAFDYGLVAEMARLVAAQGVATPQAAPSKAVQQAKQHNLAAKVQPSKNQSPPTVASKKGTAPTKQRMKPDLSKLSPAEQTEAIDDMFDSGDLF